MSEQLMSPITNKVTVTSGSVAYAKSTIFPVKPEAKTYSRTSIKRREGGVASADKATLTEEVIGELRRLYVFRDDLVEGFLEDNPSLGDLLLEAYEIILGHFGSEVELALEIVADPEAPEDQELFVVIRPKVPPKKARALLSELDQGWWRDVSPIAQGKMELGLE